MRLDHGLRDRESEAGARSSRASARRVPPIEPRERLAHLVGTHSRPVIPYVDAHARVLGVDQQLDRRPCGGVHSRVGQQVVEHLPQPDGIPFDDGFVRRDDTDLAVWCRNAQGVGAGRHDRYDVERVALERTLLIESRKQQQVVDEDAHARRLLFDARHRARPIGLVGERPRAGELGVAADRRERRPQLVARVGDEAPEPVFAGGALVERLLDLPQHAVERVGETSDLGAGGHVRHALAEVAGGNAFGRALDVLERPQTHPDHAAGHETDQTEGEQPHGKSSEHDSRHRVVHGCHRDGDDDTAVAVGQRVGDGAVGVGGVVDPADVEGLPALGLHGVEGETGEIGLRRTAELRSLTLRHDAAGGRQRRDREGARQLAIVVGTLVDRAGGWGAPVSKARRRLQLLVELTDEVGAQQQGGRGGRENETERGQQQHADGQPGMQ